MLEDKDNMKAVVVIVEWKDTQRTVAWSDMRVSEACMSLKVFDAVISREVEISD